MAALLRGLRTARALRGLRSVVAAPATATHPQCVNLRAVHRAALLLQDDSKSDKTSTTYHVHYQAHSAEQEASTASKDTAPASHNTPPESQATPLASTDTPSASQETVTTSQETTSESQETVTASQETTTASEETTAESQAASGSDTTEEGSEGSTSFQEEGEEYETEEQLQARILAAALEFVPLHGWTMEAIAAGAETIGLSSASTGMFYKGAGDLVLSFIAHCNAQMTEILAEQHKQVQLGQAEPKETADFLRDAVETRLRMYIPYIETWPQAMSILLLPHNIPDSLKHLSTMVDDIWYYAGDRSTDLNWYTKRAALTGIFNTTELVLVQDSSPEFQDTWNFLDNRIKDVVNMANTAKQVQATGEAVVQGMVGAAVTLKNLTGLNQRR